MAGLQPQDAYIGAMKALALMGLQHRKVTTAKKTVGTSPVAVPLPTDVAGSSGVRPRFVKVAYPSPMGALYMSSGTPASLPVTDTSDGNGEHLSSDDVIVISTQEALSLIAEVSGVVTLTFYWTI